MILFSLTIFLAKSSLLFSRVPYIEVPLISLTFLQLGVPFSRQCVGTTRSRMLCLPSIAQIALVAIKWPSIWCNRSAHV